MNKVEMLCVSLVDVWHQNNPYTVELVMKLIIVSRFLKTESHAEWGIAQGTARSLFILKKMRYLKQKSSILNLIVNCSTNTG